MDLKMNLNWCMGLNRRMDSPKSVQGQRQIVHPPFVLHRIPPLLTLCLQVKSLLISLGNNMCMVLAKQSKFLEVIKVSKQVTDIDAVNLKAMYRTGMAQRSTGNLDKARTTLKRALELHPDSRECKLELANVKKSMDDAKKKEKALFGGTFDKGGLGNLYQDKEEENRLKKIKKIEDGKKEKLVRTRRQERERRA